MVNIEDVTPLSEGKEVPFAATEVHSFEEWARVSHLKESTLEVLKCNDIDDISTVKLLNNDDIRRLPIKLGQAKLLEYAVKKLKRADSSTGSLSKDTSLSSPERKSDSFYIVPSPNKSGRKSPAKFSQVEVDEEDPDDPEGSPCTIRITIETKKEDQDESCLEELLKPKNLLSDLIEDTMLEEAKEPQKEESQKEEHQQEEHQQEEPQQEEHRQEEHQNDENKAADEVGVEEIIENRQKGEEINVENANIAAAEQEIEHEERSEEDEHKKDEFVENVQPFQKGVHHVQEPVHDVEQEQEVLEDDHQEIPADELEETRTDVDLEVKGEGILPPPPPPVEPIVVPAEVKRIVLEANDADLSKQVNISANRRIITIPCAEILSDCKAELIKNAARRIVAESIAENGCPKSNDDEVGTQDRLSQFFSGANGSTLIRLSNDHGTLKFLVPHLSEMSVQTDDVEEVEETREDEARDEDTGDIRDLDSISGELAIPLVDDDMPPPAEDTQLDEERDRMPEPPSVDEPELQKPVAVNRKESVAFDPAKHTMGPNFHTPKGVNKFGNYMQVQMLGEDLHNPPTERRPMSPVVSQPIRWECNRDEKGSPPRKTSSPNKNSSPVRHRTPSPQRFKSPDRVSRSRQNGVPAGTAYRSTGEIDPRTQHSPPREIVNKIRTKIESPSAVKNKYKSPPKPRSPSPVKPFDTEAFRLARKLAQEVADCPPDCIMVRVKDLQKCPKALLPPELDKSLLENYISDSEFRRVLGMTRDDFATYSEWKQQEIKKELGLF